MKKSILSIIMLFLFVCHAKSINDTLIEQNKLIEDVKNDFMSIMISMENLKNENSNLLMENKEMKKLIENNLDKINKLEENIIFLKEALMSNKEDSSIIMKELGLMFSQVEEYRMYLSSIENKHENLSLFMNITIPLATLPMMVYGACEFANGNEKLGKLMIYSSAGLFIGLELTYQSGRFIFKKW